MSPWDWLGLVLACVWPAAVAVALPWLVTDHHPDADAERRRRLLFPDDRKDRP